MKFIPLGLQCSVPEGIKSANLREYSYPFDWLWTPSKTTYDILTVLLNDGVANAVQYMTTGYSYYDYLGNERYTSRDDDASTISQMNKTTGLGITHFTINDDYKTKLSKRLEILLRDIQSLDNEIVFIYADAAKPELNYHLDDVEYGLDATEYLIKIYHLLYPINHNIKILYFCWKERKQENSHMIEYIPFEYQSTHGGVAGVIKDYLLRTYTQFNRKSIEYNK